MDLSTMNEQEKRIYFEEINQQNKISKHSSKCMYDECDKLSIGSHTISKNYFIKNISENNKVLGFCPRRDSASKELVLKRIGINKASVFHGFCKKHDEIFNCVDLNGINTINDLILQCYRSVCFWLHMLMIDGKTIGTLQEDADDSLRNTLKEKLPTFNYDKFRFGTEYQKNKIDYTCTTKGAKDILEKWLTSHKTFDPIQGSIAVYIEDLEILYCKVNEVIPVTLNTMNTTSVGNVFQIVLPNESHTDIIVINASHKRIKLLDTWKIAMSNMLNIIELVESWMIANEEWYIKPSIIEQIPKERLDIICNDIRYWQGESKLWEVYDMSIFDDLRKKYYKLYEEHDNLDENYKAKEQRKFIPQKRLPREEREANMLRKMAQVQYYGVFSEE